MDSAVLLVQPDSEKRFQFPLRPAWELTPAHDLVMIVNGRKSTIDGVISDRNSAFRFNFVDKLEVVEKFSLVFKGEWHNDPAADDPGRIVYEYDIADSPDKGRFVLPNKLAIDNNFNVLSYSYEKDGRTRSVQLVGQLQFNQFELSYTIDRKSSAEGNSTTLKFDVNVTGATSEGKIGFALKKADGSESGTTLTIGGAYSAKFKSGVLTIAFGFSQQTTGGTVTSRELTFGGQLQHKGGTTFTWELQLGNGMTSISIAADQIQLGPGTLDAKVSLQMQGGEVKCVRALLGFSF